MPTNFAAGLPRSAWPGLLPLGNLCAPKLGADNSLDFTCPRVYNTHMQESVPQYPLLKPSDLSPPMNVTLVTDGSGLEKLARYAQRVLAAPTKMHGLDTETNMAVDFWFRRVRTIQLGDKDEQFVIDLLPFAGSDDKLENSQAHYGKNNAGLYEPIFKILDPLLLSGEVLKVGQNLPFEYEVFNWNFGRRIWHLYSTDLAERVIQAGGSISLKQYKKFSMLALVERYFNKTIDKSQQKSFDLSSPLTEEQIYYAALDIRMPLALRAMQMRVLMADRLYTTATIENDAIGSYVDMHLVGQNIDDERWVKRIEKVNAQRVEDLKVLDQEFIPVVGHKDTAIDYEELKRLESIWRNDFEVATQDEIDKSAAIRAEPDKDKKNKLRADLENLKKKRKADKQIAHQNFSELSKQRTAKLKIIPKCEGEAFLNYGSNPQLLATLNKFPGMKHITSVGDDTLLKFNDRPMIQILRKYRKGKKETGTYGLQWIQRWLNKPSKEEGFRHPGDGRLHCVFNQLEAETGRSSSSKPNAQNLPKDDEVRACFICDPPDADEPDGYVIVTIDMNGAELRIIAELAQAKTWINAFAKGQDVHSVSTEILYPDKWPGLAAKGGEIHFDKEKDKEVILPPCAYYQKATERIVLDNGQVIETGDLLRKKCKCPGHIDLRNGTKAINFLLCYGGGPDALADELGITVDAAKDLMKLHESKFPDVWGYLRRSGELAKELGEARDLYGRRRLFTDPTPDTARAWFEEFEEEKLELSEEQIEANTLQFKTQNFREPTKDEMWLLSHRPPTAKEISSAMRAMMGSIARKGKNHAIQGSNASIIKRAMGCGIDKNGKPYLWHTLLQYKAKILNMVHDELVIQCPRRFGEQVKQLVGDAFKRAASEVMTSVVMEFDGIIAGRWMK